MNWAGPVTKLAAWLSCHSTSEQKTAVVWRCVYLAPQGGETQQKHWLVRSQNKLSKPSKPSLDLQQQSQYRPKQPSNLVLGVRATRCHSKPSYCSYTAELQVTRSRASQRWPTVARCEARGRTTAAHIISWRVKNIWYQRCATYSREQNHSISHNLGMWTYIMYRVCQFSPPPPPPSLSLPPPPPPHNPFIPTPPNNTQTLAFLSKHNGRNGSLLAWGEQLMHIRYYNVIWTVSVGACAYMMGYYIIAPYMERYPLGIHFYINNIWYTYLEGFVALRSTLTHHPVNRYLLKQWGGI